MNFRYYPPSPLLVFFTNKRDERGSKSKLVVKNDGSAHAGVLHRHEL
jgi:hypothetical protein